MNTFLKIGIANLTIIIIENSSMGIVTKNIQGNCVSMKKLIIKENISISGARIAVRIIIINDICTFPTSVVRRVTSDDELNLSILANE